jgi:putative transposase
MTISNELLDELLKGCKRPEDLLGEAGLMKELKVRLMERMLGAELTAHLGYEAGAEPPLDQPNRRNGVSTKRVKGSDGEVPLAVPRDRDGSFEPELVKKGQTRIDGVDDKIIGLYAAGLSARDIQGHLEELYGLRVSPDLISRVTDAVLDEVREWQHRALDRMYPIVIFDALRVKIRDADSRMVKNKAVYIALGVTREGDREVLGLWIADNEGAKFWLLVMNKLRNRGVQDILIAVVDGRRRRRFRLHSRWKPPEGERFSRSHHRGLPADHGANLRGASHPSLDEFLQLEGSQGRSRRFAPDL